MMRPSLAVVLTSSLLWACGGESTNEDQTGGTGGKGATGGTSGSGGSGGAVTGGGGSGGIGGVGGVGGTGATGGTSTGGATGTCSPQQEALATLNPPPIGFSAPPPNAPTSATVLEVKPALIELGGTITAEFRWVGPDLSQKFKAGDSVTFGTENGWHYVAGGSYTALAFKEMAFVAPDPLPQAPYYAPKISYGAECQFPEPGACGKPGANVRLLSVEATTGAGPLTILHGETKTLVGWEITNVSNVQYPGYGGETCVVEAAFSGNITALGPALDPG